MTRRNHQAYVLQRSFGDQNLRRGLEARTLLRGHAKLVIPVVAIAVGVLLILALYNLPAPWTQPVPGPRVFGTVPVPVGTLSLSFRKVDGTSTGEYWAGFKFVMNSTKSYRLTGAWVATEPTWGGSGQLVWIDEGMPRSCPAGGCPPPSTWPRNGVFDRDFILWTGCGYDHGVLVPTKPYNETWIVFFVSPLAATILVTQPILLQEVPTTQQCQPTLGPL